MEHVFYFDESFHDRKIVLSQKGTINVLREDGIDDYIGTFWGCEQRRLNEYKQVLEDFENKYRAVFSLPEGKELKSEIIGKKNFQYGIHSFNRNALGFYHDLFSLLSNWDFIIQINIISKIELFIRNSLEYVDLPRIANKQAFIYSLTKLLVVHKPVQLITAMNDVANGADGSLFWAELSKTLKAYSEASEGAARKTQTIVAFREMGQIINQIKYNPSIERKTDFQYYPNFEGLCNLLNELGMDPHKIKLTIDTEEKTIAAARKYGFGRVKPGCSDTNIQIRLSDWVGGLIGRMLFAMHHDESSKERSLVDINCIDKEDIKRKRLLSHQWFELDKEQFEMYKLLHEVFNVQHEHYWTTLTLTYCDDSISFFSLLRYLANYKSIDEYNTVQSKLHAEYYNNCAVQELNEYYQRIEAEASSAYY